MRLRPLNLLLIVFVALTACATDPEPPAMDRRYLHGEHLEAEKSALLANVSGEVLDSYEWTYGDQLVYTVLSHEQEADTDFSGLYLRQYDLNGQHANLLWTYKDTVSCGAAGAVEVVDYSPALRAVSLTGDDPDGFVLVYQLGCSAGTEAARDVVFVDAATGTPTARLSGRPNAVSEAVGLHELPRAAREQLLALLAD